MQDARSLDALEEKLGYEFANRVLLERALTHASVGVENSNERLEFLGDRVLGLVIAEWLYERFPDETEGGLAVRLNALVRRDACARAGTAAGLPDHLRLAQSESGSGGRAKPAIVAGACEAVIAALYLDGGFEAARSYVLRYWAPELEALAQDMRDAKTALQEWAQADRARGQPVYKVIARQGPDHAPIFTVEVSLPRRESCTGQGASKRDAEQAAARAMLREIEK
ncbi:MAG: ribonuclease III [Alphaproteobacteria bacterium]